MQMKYCRKKIEKFRMLKETLLPEIEIVQMKYGNQLQHGTVYNFDEEYRPKLFKRLREFEWIAPIHETIRLEPVVYDSDIIITHLPENLHAKRDLHTFAKHVAKGLRLSKRLHSMYARELYLAGDIEDFAQAVPFFMESAEDTERSSDELTEACCVVAKWARLAGEHRLFLKYSAKLLVGEGCSEICCELGQFHEDAQDYVEAAIWYYNAVYETTPAISIHAGGSEALEGLVRCYEKMGLEEQAALYRQEAEARA
jgi:hypothetical protein